MTEINEVENQKKKKERKTNETKICSFEKINKPLMRLNRNKSEKTQTVNFRNERGYIAIDARGIKRMRTTLCQ